MDWKGKANWIVLLTIIALVGYGVARTAYYNDRTDALNALGSEVSLVAGDCTILSIEESIAEGDATGDIIATIEMPYTRGGSYDRRIGTTLLDNATQQEAENKAGVECDTLWAGIQAEAGNQTIDTVVVEYQKGTLSDILNRAYDVGKKTWGNVLGQVE